MPSLVGKEIGKYRIVERIGRGGMAEVYKGIHTHLERQVAIKVLHNYLLDEGGDFVERFKREAKAIANLQHPNIVQVYDFDIQDDLIFMVMDYIDGTNLQKLLKQLCEERKRLSTSQIGSIINDIANALDYAHSKGILHRDIKPSNILIDKNGKAYLTDFGIAKIIGDPKITATGMLVGTPAYMSPEQGRGENLTKESDIYSLGIVAFEMLTGQVPYDAPTPIGIIHKQITEPIPNIGDLVDDVPNTAQDVIEKVLAKSPDDRYSSADELVFALRLTLQAVESDETSRRKSTQKTTNIDKEALYAPTVKIQEESTPDVFEQPTTIMEDDQPEQKQEDNLNLIERETEKAPVVGKDRKRKIPLWGVIIAVVILLVAAAIGFPRVMEFGSQPTSEAKSPNVVQTQTDSLPQSSSETEVTLTEPTSTITRLTPTIVRPTPTKFQPTATSTQVLEIVGVVFDANHTEDGLYTHFQFDYDVEEITVGEGQEIAWRTGNGRILPSDNNNQWEDYYMEFIIDFDPLYAIPLGRLVRIEVEYLDEGTDNFRIQYDSHSGGPYGTGIFQDTDFIKKTDSGIFKTAVFELYDAYFAHRNNDSDFRIDDAGDGAETIRRVRVMLFPK
jgi:serine/threonine protein kinase